MRQSEIGERYAELAMELIRLEASIPNLEARVHLTDIRRRAESLYESLITKLHLLETVLENSPETIYSKDKEGRYTYINQAAEHEFKLMRETSLGKTDFELFPPANAEEYRSGDLIAMETRKAWEYEVLWDNKTYLVRKLPLISASGEVLGVCGNTINITNHRRTELALQAAVRSLERERENKLMNIEAVMAAIAHEMRQPLTAISTNGSAALRFLGKTPPDINEVRAGLQRIIGQCRHVDGVFDGIRGLFRRGAQNRQPISVNDITLEVLEGLSRELAERGVASHTEFTSDLPLVDANMNQLREVISNLVQNAMEAMDFITDRQRILTLKTKLQDGGTVMVEVQDTGPGIDPKRLDSIFEAFVSTKSHGIGLGLALCRMIVERHDGRLTALSDGISGASFKFILPVKSMLADTGARE
jgi:PAS domain S-box-containing protein